MSKVNRKQKRGRPKSGKPHRKLIAIRIDPTLLSKLRELARKQDKPYQSFIHEVLEQTVQVAGDRVAKVSC